MGSRQVHRDEQGWNDQQRCLTGGERRQSAIAMTTTQVLVVAKAHMIRLLHTQPELMNRFIAHLLARNTRLEAHLTDQIFHSSEQRLAHVLLALASGDERRLRRRALPDLPQEIIAEMVGTTRSRVNFFMGRFKKLGFVEEHGGVLQVNPAVFTSFTMGIDVSQWPQSRRFRSVGVGGEALASGGMERHWPLAG